MFCCGNVEINADSGELINKITIVTFSSGAMCTWGRWPTVQETDNIGGDASGPTNFLLKRVCEGDRRGFSRHVLLYGCIYLL